MFSKQEWLRFFESSPYVQQAWKVQILFSKFSGKFSLSITQEATLYVAYII